MVWFDEKFGRDVSRNLLTEKVHKRISGTGNPDGAALRAGYANIRTHLAYIDWLAETRRWLAGNQLSLADFAAAAHLSCLDFLDDVDWSRAPAAKDWYARVKSRPASAPCCRTVFQALRRPPITRTWISNA